MKTESSIIDMCVSLHAYTKNRNLVELDKAIDHAIRTAKHEIAAKRMLCDSCQSVIKHSDYREPNA